MRQEKMAPIGTYVSNGADITMTMALLMRWVIDLFGETLMGGFVRKGDKQLFTTLRRGFA